MADLKGEVLKGVPGLGFVFDDGRGTIKGGSIGDDGMQPLVIVWITRPTPTIITYAHTGRSAMSPQEIIAHPDILADMQKGAGEVTSTDLERIRESLIIHNAPTK